jgi:DNA-binding MarR family transcriptional regulator
MRVFHLLQRAHAGVYREADRMLTGAFGVSAAQLGVLFVLTEGEGRTLRDVAGELGLSPQGLTGLVDRMEVRGLVRRIPNPADGRSQLLVLEASGRDLAAQAGGLVQEVNRRILEPFNAEQRAVIRAFLERVAAAGPLIDPPDAGQSTSEQKDSP